MSFRIIKYRKSFERFHTNKTWLDSRHSFSFGEYRENNWDNFGSISVINEDIISPKSGFNMHSHSNMEIITIVIEGCITHKDSLGNIEKIYANEVQIMTAGTGISHRERNEEDLDCKLLQIWIYPFKENLRPLYKKNSLIKNYGNEIIINSDDSNDLYRINQNIS